MAILKHQRLGATLLGHLYDVLTTDYPRIDPRHIAFNCGLGDGNWWRQQHKWPLHVFSLLFAYLRDQHIDDLSLDIARRSQLSDLGEMSFALMTAASVREGIDIAIYGLTQLEIPLAVNIETPDTNSSLLFSENHTPRDDYRNSLQAHNEHHHFDKYAELTIAMALRYIRSFDSSGQSLRPVQIDLSGPATAYSAKLRAYFGSKLNFNSAHNAIHFRRGQLSQTRRVADINSISQKVIQCQQLVKQRSRASILQHQVEQALLEDSQGSDFSLATAADTLSLRGPELRRQLRDEGLSFRDIAQQVRMELASDYLLNSSLSIQEISYKLHYQEPNNFTRAFKKRFGTPPGSYRNTTGKRGV